MLKSRPPSTQLRAWLYSSCTGKRQQEWEQEDGRAAPEAKTQAAARTQAVALGDSKGVCLTQDIAVIHFPPPWAFGRPRGRGFQLQAEAQGLGLTCRPMSSSVSMPSSIVSPMYIQSTGAPEYVELSTPISSWPQA